MSSEEAALQEVLVVGVDPHRETVDAVAVRFPEEIVLDEVFDNTQTGHHKLWSKAQGLARDLGLTLVFGLEDGSNYGRGLSRFLLGAGSRVKEVNPLKTNRQRDFYGQDKTNHLDALATAAVVFRVFDQLPDMIAVQDAVQATYDLSRYRERLVKEQTAAINRLHGYLANQYPAYKEFFSEVSGVTALHFWASFPTTAHLQGTSVEELADLFYVKSNHCLTAAACTDKAQCILASLDDAPDHSLDLLTVAQGEIITDLAQRLLTLRRSIAKIERRLADTLPLTGQKLETIKGMGTVLAAVFVAETRDTARFYHDPNKFARYNGSGPASRGSGQHLRQVQNRWCNRRLKVALERLALTAARREPLSKAYYQTCLDRGLDTHQARKRLMRRLSDIIFAMMRDKAAYDPEIHRLKKRRLSTKKRRKRGTRH
jgi:transposase